VAPDGRARRSPDRVQIAGELGAVRSKRTLSTGCGETGPDAGTTRGNQYGLALSPVLRIFQTGCGDRTGGAYGLRAAGHMLPVRPAPSHHPEGTRLWVAW
jgi:hypothetical protein